MVLRGGGGCENQLEVVWSGLIGRDFQWTYPSPLLPTLVESQQNIPVS